MPSVAQSVEESAGTRRSTWSRRTSPTTPPSPRWRSTTTGSSTGRSPGCTSTSGCSSSPRTQPAAAGAGPLPGDLHQQPRRVLHGPGGRPQAPDRRGRGRPRRLRAAAARGARGHLDHVARADEAAREPVPRRDRAGVVPGRHRAGSVGRPGPRRAEVLQAAVQGAGLPRADPAGGRPGAPVPLHLGALAQPRGRRAQPEDRQGALRAGEGAADLRAVRAAGQPAVRAAGGRDRRAPQAALPRHGGARGPHVPGHPQRGPRGRGGRRREPARGAREGAAAAPVRAAGAARGRGVDLADRAGPADLRARGLPRTRCSG